MSYQTVKQFGEKLRILRRRRGLIMRHLGETLEVSDSYVSKMETGDKIPDVAMVIKIADFFEADLNQLLRDELVLACESRRLIVKVRRLVYCRVGDLIWGALRDGCRRN